VLALAPLVLRGPIVPAEWPDVRARLETALGG